MTTPLGVRQPPRIFVRCACGLTIDTFADDELKQHAVRVHNELPRHREWAEANRRRDPDFYVRVVDRRA